MNEAENQRYTQRWLPAKVGAPLLGYQKLDAFYRDVREGYLSPHYWERRGKRVYVNALALISAPSVEKGEAQNQVESLPAAA